MSDLTAAYLLLVIIPACYWLYLVITEHFYWKGFRNGKRLYENTVEASKRVTP